MTLCRLGLSAVLFVAAVAAVIFLVLSVEDYNARAGNRPGVEWHQFEIKPFVVTSTSTTTTTRYGIEVGFYPDPI